MTPKIPRRVLSAVDADEAATAKVSVVAEVNGLSRLRDERNPDMERNIRCGTVGADVVVCQQACCVERTVAVAIDVATVRGALGELVQRAHVRAAAANGRVELALRCVIVNASEIYALAVPRAFLPDNAAANATATTVLDPRLQVVRLALGITRCSLVQRVAAPGVAAVLRARVTVARPSGWMNTSTVAPGRLDRAVRDRALRSVADLKPGDSWEFCRIQRSPERVQRSVSVAEVAADNIRRRVAVPQPVATNRAPRRCGGHVASRLLASGTRREGLGFHFDPAGAAVLVAAGL